MHSKRTLSWAVLGSCLIALMLLPVAASAATYYVAKTGSDSNPGTEAQPWLTIQKAANTLVAGDTVYVKAGTYEEIVRPVNSGTEGNYITYSAYPGATVIIDLVNLRTTFWDAGFVITTKSYIKVSGFQVKNCTGGFGLLAQTSSHHITFENNYTYNTCNSGIATWEGDHDILIQGNEVELACNDGYQECISADHSYNVQVLNNHVHHSGPGSHGGEGIDIKNGSHDCLVRGNYVHDINRLGIYVDSYNDYLYNVTVDQNIVHNCWNHGIALACEKNQPMENVTVTNNLCYTNGWAGITVGNWNGGKPKPFNNIKIINNTCYDNGQPWGQVPGDGFGIINLNGASCTNLVIRNNIVSQNLDAQLMNNPGCAAVIDYNVIYGPQTGDWVTYGTNYILADPLFVNPANADFHLQSGSPAIDAGSSVSAPDHDLDGNARPVNGLWDIGCYEYGGGAPQPPVANFSGNPTSGNAPLTVYFTDTSTGSPTSWSWTFGDGGTSTAQNPSHQYTSANQYTVSLTATNAAGQDTETKTNYITVTAGQPPVANFSGNPTSGYAPLTVAFTDLSTNSPTSWSWTFGDGGTSTAQNPSHQYTTANQYTVSLTATNQYGSDGETKTNYITVQEQPSQSCHVGAIDLVLGPNPKYKAKATITIHDQVCAPLAGVSVTVQWSHNGTPVGSPQTGTTNTSGQVVFTDPQAVAGTTHTCCVTNLAKTGYTYNSAANHETCDSITLP